MTIAKRIQRVWYILRWTGAYRILLSYLCYILLDAALILLVEPTIHTYGDALWYCYAVLSTAGFGDFVATTALTRILSIFLTIYSIFVLAIITGVVVNYYTELIEMKNKDTLAAFMDRLERLPELDHEELKELAQRVRRFRNGMGNPRR